MAPVVKELQNRSGTAKSVVCVTGQHRELLDQGLSIFQIKPDYDLRVLEENQSLSKLTINLFKRLEHVVEQVRPDWIIAEGDTTTVLVAALVSYYQRVAFGHLEAGLRTGDKYRPFPEEINRRIADQVADVMFAPTELNRRNLLREGIRDEAILVTGNTVIDALLQATKMKYSWASGPLSVVPRDKRLVLITAHRRESFGEPLREICRAIKELALRFGPEGCCFVYPVHPNPNVQKPVKEILTGVPHVNLIRPLDYLSMVHLMKSSSLILTDSGGIQEEAPSLGVPVLVMRETSERPEAIEAGVCRLVGTDRRRIVEIATRLLQDPAEYESMATKKNPYGDGKAAQRIVSYLVEHSK